MRDRELARLVRLAQGCITLKEVAYGQECLSQLWLWQDRDWLLTGSSISELVEKALAAMPKKKAGDEV